MPASSCTTLVTGGCGYIGRQLCLRLLALGNSVVVVDNLQGGLHPDIWLKDAISGRLAENGRISYRLGHDTDAGTPMLHFVQQDAASFFAALQRQERAASATGWPSTYAAMFHLAAPTQRMLQEHGGALGVAHQLATDGQVFAWLLTHGKCIERFIYVSPMDVHTPTATVNFAAHAGEQLAVLLARASAGMQVVCARLAAVYGKDQHSEHFVAAMAHRVLRANIELILPKPIVCAYDLLHVDDAVEGLLFASQHGAGAQPITLGTTVFTTPEQLATMMASARQQPLTVHSRGYGDAQNQSALKDAVASSLSAIRFRPKVTLGQGLPQVLRFAVGRQLHASSPL